VARRTVTRIVTVELNHLVERGGKWYYRRRVPREVAHLDPRREVKVATRISTRTDPDGGGAAAAFAAGIDAELEQYWADLLAGRDPEERKRTARAITQAQALGVTYRAAEDVVRLPTPEILKRTEILFREYARGDADKPPSPAAQAALREATLGGTAKSGILVSGLTDTFFAIVAANMRRKSDKQLHAWKVSKKASTKNFIKANADMDILAIEKSHAVAFHAWWSARLITEKMNPASANKDLWNMSLMIRAICNHYGLGKDPGHFTGMAFDKDRKKRKAFKVDWVLQNIWPRDALPGINQEAHDITIVLVETGARPIEICALNKRSIILDANIPYIRIFPDQQELKTRGSERDIPLVGRALEVMRRYPNGFPRYYMKPDGFCNLINYHLKLLQPEVRPDEGDKYQTVYCLRHLFKDRLRHARVEDEMKLALMGHSEGSSDDNKEGHDYGEGFELQHKLDTLQKIALPFAL
jgi:integrase